MSRFRRTIAGFAVLVLSMSLLAGCASKTSETPAAEEPVKLSAIRIGVLPTEDSLPLWVADKEGLFADAGLDVSFVNFQAAAERDAAFTAGEIDAFMGDIIAAALLEQGGSSVTIGTIMLGATPAEGRFGIAVPADSAYQGLGALAGVPVGTSSSTIQEYVLDGLMRQAGVPADKVATEEVKKVPVRFELLMAGKLKAAALPEPFLSLAEAQGAKIIATDTEGENLSQTILGFSDDYLVAPGGIEA
ncbi:MAG: MetQ/NlpA family ABC transporter substrate-binding protein, partial [Coriobacteriia bacterium]|nr:MetQ/NlpA family ABC transporter substrate-binding protein [Coriobacteriia bacterium]